MTENNEVYYDLDSFPLLSNLKYKSNQNKFFDIISGKILKLAYHSFTNVDVLSQINCMLGTRLAILNFIVQFFNPNENGNRS